ncbi:MAG: hypothetical protein QOH35_990 [Acidobacteriaceae bacterium]|nr:hypothetical protein [Acidobacteriaceae bacterium]
MVADKVSQKGCRFRRARILRNHMNAVRFFVETVSRTVNMLRAPFHLHAHRTLENIADDRTRMAMRRGRAARRIGHFDCRHVQVIRI